MELAGEGSRIDLISDNGAVVGAFALTRVAMAAVILGTLFISGFSSGEPALVAVQTLAAIVSVVAVGVSVVLLLQRGRRKARNASGPWTLIVLDSILALGVMSVIDTETSPLAWVALITPVLETAVLYSMASAGFVWLGLSLGFLSLRLATNVSDDATTEALVLSIQQVLAVLFVSGPAALMADSAQQRIDSLADARRSADATSQRLRTVANSAREMSQHQGTDALLGLASSGALKIGFDQADVVVRSNTGQLSVHSMDSVGSAVRVSPEVLTSDLDEGISTLLDDDLEDGDALRKAGFTSGHAVAVSNPEGGSEPAATLRVWKKDQPATTEDFQALSLLVRHCRDSYRASELLSEAQAHADQLRYEVRHDGLTGLANRSFVLETLEERLAAEEPVALLFIDLDGFKAVNDRLGHNVGDDALIEVASRLEATRRDGELAGRMGGDEFVLITPMTAFDTLETIKAYGDEIVDALDIEMRVGDLIAPLGGSVGIAVHDGHVDADQLISLADTAMYEAKRAGGGTVINPDSVDVLTGKLAS